MPLNPSGAISLGGPTAGQSIAVELGLSPTASISLNQTDVRTLAGVPSGTIIMPTNFYGKSSWLPTQQGIVAFGGAEGSTIVYGGRQLVTSTGVVGATAATVGPARRFAQALTYGGDKAIIGGGMNPAGFVSVNNLVSNTGVVASSTPSAGTPFRSRTSATYGGDKGIFAFGLSPGSPFNNTQNLVSNTGVYAADIPGVGTPRSNATAVNYGGRGNTAIVYGGIGAVPTSYLQVVNYISNTGVVASDTPTVASYRIAQSAATYGNDTALFFGGNVRFPPAAGTSRANSINYVTNTGVLGADISAAPQSSTGRTQGCGIGYGGDKGIVMYGETNANTQNTNTISNTGVFGAQIAYATSPENRSGSAAAGFSYT